MHVPQLQKPVLSLCSATREATPLRNLHTATRRSPRTANRESPCNNEDLAQPRQIKLCKKIPSLKYLIIFIIFVCFPNYLLACMLSRFSCVQPFVTLCSLTGCSVHGILQARLLGWVATSSSRSFQPRDQTCVSCVSWIAGGFFPH